MQNFIQIRPQETKLCHFEILTFFQTENAQKLQPPRTLARTAIIRCAHDQQFPGVSLKSVEYRKSYAHKRGFTCVDHIFEWPKIEHEKSPDHKIIKYCT